MLQILLWPQEASSQMGSVVELTLDARRHAHFLQVLQPSVLQNWGVLPESTAVWPGQCLSLVVSQSWGSDAKWLHWTGCVSCGKTSKSGPPVACDHGSVLMYPAPATLCFEAGPALKLVLLYITKRHRETRTSSARACCGLYVHHSKSPFLCCYHPHCPPEWWPGCDGHDWWCKLLL